MLRKFNKLAFSGTQSARAAANWQKEIYTTVDYDPNEPKAWFQNISRTIYSLINYRCDRFPTRRFSNGSNCM